MSWLIELPFFVFCIVFQGFMLRKVHASLSLLKRICLNVVFDPMFGVSEIHKLVELWETTWLQFSTTICPFYLCQFSRRSSYRAYFNGKVMIRPLKRPFSWIWFLKSVWAAFFPVGVNCWKLLEIVISLKTFITEVSTFGPVIPSSFWF